MKLLVLHCFAMFVFINGISAQTLIANGGFEDKNVCVEYHATCAPEAWFRIPGADVYVKSGSAQSHSGLFFQNLAVENLRRPVSFRSFIYTKILCPLIRDTMYNMSLWVNSLNNDFDHLDVWLPDVEPIASKKSLKEISPQIIFTKGHVLTGAHTGWFKVSYLYKARGDERYLMIGNFSQDPLAASVKTNGDEDVLYQVDDIELKPLSFFAPCDEYEAIRQQLYDVNYRHTPRRLIDDIPLRKPLIGKQPIPIDSSATKEITLVIVYTPPSMKEVKAVNDTLVLPDILFRFNSSVINPAFAGLLDSALRQIKKATYRQIEIVGHTDNAGTGAYNIRLSLNRASSVKEYFLKKQNFDPATIQIFGKGEEQPVAENTTAEGRQRNRRVEIILVK